MTRAGFEKTYRRFEATPQHGGVGLDGKKEITGYNFTEKRGEILPARPRKEITLAGCPLPVRVSEGQLINPRKEHKRQMKKLGKRIW